MQTKPQVPILTAWIDYKITCDGTMTYNQYETAVYRVFDNDSITKMCGQF